MSKKKATSLVWFRNNLRVLDNISLSKSIEESDKTIGYINIDPKDFKESRFGFKKIEKFRAKFLLESIADLKKNLKKLNISLIVTHEDLGSSINKVVNKYQIDNIYLQREWTRDEIIQEKNIPNDINLIKDFDQFMYLPNDVSEIYDNIPRGFSNFRKKCEKLLTINDTLPSPVSLNIDNQIDDEYSVPSLSDLGYDYFEVHRESAFKFTGGETSGINS